MNMAAAKKATARSVSLPVLSTSWRIGVGNTNLYKSGEGGVNCGAGFTSCMSLEASNLTAGTIRTMDLSNPMSGSQFMVLGGDTEMPSLPGYICVSSLKPRHPSSRRLFAYADPTARP